MRTAIKETTKNLAVVALAGLGMLASSSAARADFTLNPDNGHYYGVVSGSYTWLQASNGAASQQFMGAKGYLATITSAAEETFVVNHFSSSMPTLPSTTPLWLGGYQPPSSAEPAGGWTWVTGETFTFTDWNNHLDWNTIEPNNTITSYGGEDSMEIFGTHGVWNDTAGGRTGSYLVEFTVVPEPGVAGLALSALGAFVIFRKRIGR